MGDDTKAPLEIEERFPDDVEETQFVSSLYIATNFGNGHFQLLQARVKSVPVRQERNKKLGRTRSLRLLLVPVMHHRDAKSLSISGRFRSR